FQPFLSTALRRDARPKTTQQLIQTPVIMQRMWPDKELRVVQLAAHNLFGQSQDRPVFGEHVRRARRVKDDRSFLVQSVAGAELRARSAKPRLEKDVELRSAGYVTRRLAWVRGISVKLLLHPV